jgi:hypothetical protein
LCAYETERDSDIVWAFFDDLVVTVHEDLAAYLNIVGIVAKMQQDQMCESAGEACSEALPSPVIRQLDQFIRSTR